MPFAGSLLRAAEEADESALGPNALNAARGDGSDSREDRRNQRRKVLQPIGCGVHDDDPEREPRDWLLELDATVHCDQDIVVAAHSAQEIAILDASPAASDHGINVVTGELQGEIYGQVLVKKDAHRPG